MGRWPHAEQQLTLCREWLESMSGVLEGIAKASGGDWHAGGPGAGGANGQGMSDTPLVASILKSVFTAIKAPTFLKNPPWWPGRVPRSSRS